MTVLRKGHSGGCDEAVGQAMQQGVSNLGINIRRISFQRASMAAVSPNGGPAPAGHPTPSNVSPPLYGGEAVGKPSCCAGEMIMAKDSHVGSVLQQMGGEAVPQRIHPTRLSERNGRPNAAPDH